MTAQTYLWQVFKSGRSVGFVRGTLAYAQAIERCGYVSMIDWKSKYSAGQCRICEKPEGVRRAR